MFISQTVLLVDDQPTTRQELFEVLHRAGFMVVEAKSTDDAVEKFDSLRPEGVMIDVTLPGTIDALVAIRQMYHIDPSASIIAVGRNSQSPRLMEALSMGAVDFLTRPIQTRSVHLCLQRNLG